MIRRIPSSPLVADEESDTMYDGVDGEEAGDPSMEEDVCVV